MPSALALLVIVAASVVVGWLVWGSVSGIRYSVFGIRYSVSRLAVTDYELLFGWVAMGLVVAGWLALLLAEVGWFSLRNVGLVWAVLVVVLVVRVLTRQRQTGAASEDADSAAVYDSTERHNSAELLHVSRFTDYGLRITDYALLLPFLLLGLWLTFRPHQFIQGGADAGVYVNIAANLVRSGGFVIHDPVLAELPATLHPALLRPLPPPEHAPYFLLPGFYATDPAAGTVVPQFYPLHPVWQAVAYGLAGVQGALVMSGLWAVLGALAVYLTARQVAGWLAGLLALAGISINALQVWFARYPTTETLTQFLLWTGLWSLGLWLDGRRPRAFWALLAGAALGETFLVRIDSFFLLAIPAVVLVWRYGTGQLRRGDGWFFVPMGLLFVHSLLHGATQSAPYFYNTFGYVLAVAERYWVAGVVALLVVVGLLLLVWRGRYGETIGREPTKGAPTVRWIGRRSLGGYRRPLVLVVMLAVLTMAAYGAVVRPNLAAAAPYFNWYDGRVVPSVDAQNIPRFNWYLSPLGFVLGVGGACLLLWRANRRVAAVLGVGLLFALLYLWRIQANPTQIYSMRRYVPAVMPFFIVAGASLLAWLMSRERATWLRAGGAILAVVWLGWLGWLARGFASQVDYAGLPAQVAQLSDRFEPEAILIFNDAAPVGQGDFLGTPLRFIHGHNVFVLRDATALETPEAREALAQTVANWQSGGRAVYWLDVPGGNTWPLDSRALTAVEDYRIVTAALEGPEERRPVAVEPVIWTGEIYRLERVH